MRAETSYWRQSCALLSLLATLCGPFAAQKRTFSDGAKTVPDPLEMGFLFYPREQTSVRLRCRLHCHRLSRCSEARRQALGLDLVSSFATREAKYPRLTLVGQFDCGEVPGWKRPDSGRILDWGCPEVHARGPMSKADDLRKEAEEAGER